MMINWRGIIGFILGCLVGGSIVYYFFPRTETQVSYQELPPVSIKSETQKQTEYVLVKPDQPGEVTRLINRDNKVYVIVNGQEYELKNAREAETVTLGENGTVQITQQLQAQVDLTELFNQRLKAELDKERFAWMAEKDSLNRPNELELGWSNHGSEWRLKRNITGKMTGYIGGTTNGKHYGAGLGIRF
ncbi:MULTISPECIES: hypothetical protein [Sporomusa]|uniref:hypothetical protein n=1 Tax=Sporomusa TaxID=2375 RepID=UPI00166832AA|nr:MULTISPECIES: hypothetical protein [Sporomusa]MCM0759454.1 hypothetical protein [Sporomusa sphaeroides DSM 2875]